MRFSAQQALDNVVRDARLCLYSVDRGTSAGVPIEKSIPWKIA